MGHDDEMRGIQVFADRSNQQRVQTLEVRSRGFEQHFLQRLYVFLSQAELGDLQLKQAQLFAYFSHFCHREDMNLVVGHQAGVKPVARRVILEQDAVFGQLRL